MTTLDGEVLTLEKHGITAPWSAESFPQLGMPKSQKPGERGDLIVSYDVMYPESLTIGQKRAISVIFRGEPSDVTFSR
jgi:DnaJ family protein B protein 4